MSYGHPPHPDPLPPGEGAPSSDSSAAAERAPRRGWTKALRLARRSLSGALALNAWLLLVHPQLGDALGEYTYGRWAALHLNWQLYGWCSLPLVGVLLLVAMFKSSSALASAYGIAVTGTMVVTGTMAFVVFWKVWLVLVCTEAR